MTATLIVQSSGERIAVPTAGLVIGRGPNQRGGAFHAVADNAVSKHHCRIWRAADGWRVEDLDSANGTYVDDAMVVAEPVALERGGVLRIGFGGSIRLVATFDDGEAAAAQVTPTTRVSDRATQPADGQTPKHPPPPPPPAKPDELAELRKQLAAALADLGKLRAELAQAHTIRIAAEERETQARLRETQARVIAENYQVDLGAMQARLAEATVVGESRKHDLAAAREKLVVAETGLNEQAAMLRRELSQRVEHIKRVEAELSRAAARSGELERALATANEARTSALEQYEASRSRLEELERVLHDQSELLRTLEPVAKRDGA